MTTAQLTSQALEAIAASDEYTAPIFRATSVGCSGKHLSDEQIDAAVNAWFTTEDTYHEPSFRQRMRAAIAATAATGETS